MIDCFEAIAFFFIIKNIFGYVIKITFEASWMLVNFNAA